MFGIDYYQIGGYQDENLKMVSLVRLQGCASWPGSILVAKTITLGFSRIRIKWTCLYFIFGTVSYQFWGYQDKKLKLAEPGQAVEICRLAWLSCCSKSLVAKVNHFQFKQGIYQYNTITMFSIFFSERKYICIFLFLFKSERRFIFKV